MLKDEFDKLMEHFNKGAEGKKVDMNEILAQSVAFFEQLQKELKEASPEDRDIIFQMMNQMHEKIHAESTRICEQTGMSEEQLLAFSENPKNFTPDQWIQIQSTKKKMMQTGRVIGKSLKTKEEGEAPPSPKKKGRRPPKKSQWLRS